MQSSAYKLSQEILRSRNLVSKCDAQNKEIDAVVEQEALYLRIRKYQHVQKVSNFQYLPNISKRVLLPVIQHSLKPLECAQLAPLQFHKNLAPISHMVGCRNDIENPCNAFNAKFPGIKKISLKRAAESIIEMEEKGVIVGNIVFELNFLNKQIHEYKYNGLYSQEENKQLEEIRQFSTSVSTFIKTHKKPST